MVQYATSLAICHNAFEFQMDDEADKLKVTDPIIQTYNLRAGRSPT